MKFYTDFFANKSRVYIRGWDDGSRIERTLDIQPTLYTDDPLLSSSTSQFKTLNSRELFPIQFQNTYEASAFRKKNDDSVLFGNTRWEYDVIDEMFPGKVLPNMHDVRIAFIDIETESEHGFPQVDDPLERVNCVTVVFRDNIYCLALGDYDAPSNVEFHKCDDEMDLFRRLVKIFQLVDPDIITGWYCDVFDIPYLISRAERLWGDQSVIKGLSPWGILRCYQGKGSFGKDPTKYEIKGRSILDYKSLYEDHGPKQPSYSLDSVAEVELGDRKIKFDGSFKDFYTSDFNRFVEYNIQDTILVQRLQEKLHFIDLRVYIGLRCKVTFSDTSMQTRMWETMIYNYLKNERNIIAPVKSHRAGVHDVEGAYVHKPVPGLYKWITSFDAKSLYPSLFMQHNISPETLLGMTDIKIDDVLNKTEAYVEALDVARDLGANLAANGAMFSNQDRGFLPEMIKEFFDERDIEKGKMLDIDREINAIEAELKSRGVA